MKNTLIKTIFTIVIVLAGINAFAQTHSQKDTTSNFSAFKRAITFGALLHTRWMASLTKNVDATGKYYAPGTPNVATNSFSLRRARFIVKAAVNDHFSTNIMVNFAEFSSNTTNTVTPSGKILENMFAKYTLNKHFNVQAGQFRPFFGLDDFVGAEAIKTYDYSNSYTCFGNSNWQGFQMGITAFGMINKNDQLPINYYAGVYNGSGRNQLVDNDKTKNIYARLDAKPCKEVTIGINAARGSMATKAGTAYGADVSSVFNLTPNKKWQLMVSGEYKDGTNFTTFTSANNAATGEIKPDLKDYRMKGFWFFPLIRYNINLPRLRALEFSPRYEYLDESYKVASNVHQTVIPNFTLVFADDYYAALQLGTTIDMYKNDVAPNTYNRNLFYAQLQLRF